MYQWVCEMSGSFVRCLIATAIVVTASTAQAAPEGTPAGPPVVKIEAPQTVPPAPANAVEAPASAPVTLERSPLSPSEAKALPLPISETPATSVQLPALATSPAKQATGQVVTPSNGGISDEERAKQILVNEQRGSKPTLHALQVESPDYNIVICEAGCGDSRAHIIYKKPVATIRSALADPAAATAPLTKKAECRGGCDGNPSQKQASLAPPAILNDSAGSWMTTVEPSTVKTPAATSKPQANKSLKEDWMARINRERAAANQEPQTIMSPPEVEIKEPLINDPPLTRER